MEFPSHRFLRVDIEPWGMSLTLQGVGADFERTAGLCGNFDGKPANDLQKPDDLAQNSGITFEQINKFVERWR